MVQLAAECTFLEAAWQVIDPGAAKLSEKHLQALEKLAFDWIIRKEAYVGGQYAAQPEILQARNQVGPPAAPAKPYTLNLDEQSWRVWRGSPGWRDAGSCW